MQAEAVCKLFMEPAHQHLLSKLAAC